MARIPTFEIPQGDTRNAEVDFTSTASDFSTTVASAAWTVEGTSVTLGGVAAVASNVATESLVAGANKSGCTLVRVQATMADGQTVSKYFRINVTDPSC
jgi:hypothetical protein